MEEAEPPECPVCLQPYDVLSVIPRVLACGHTTCEICLEQLPNPFPNTIRCSICTVLVRCPKPPSSLPKNLDLLHFSLKLHNHHSKEHAVRQENGIDQELFPLTVKSWWSCKFARKWNKWIVPKDCVSIKKASEKNDEVIASGKAFRSYEDNYGPNFCGLRENEKLGLVKIGIFREGSNGFRYSYESRIMKVLFAMEEEKRNKLAKIVYGSLRINNVGKACGLWCNEDDNFVYILFQKFDSPKLINCVMAENANDKENLRADDVRSLATLGIEMCEIFCSLRFEGLVIGFLSLGSFGFSGFGRVYLNLFEILNMGRELAMLLQKSRRNLADGLLSKFLDVFISPELLWQHLSKNGFQLDGGNFKFEVGYASDVWSLACCLVRLLVGSSFAELIVSFLHLSVIALTNGDCDYSSIYMGIMEKITSLLDGRLGSDFIFLKDILLKCMGFNPQNRPLITDLWKCLRELVIKPQFDIEQSLKQETEIKHLGPLIVLGELFWIDDEKEKDPRSLMNCENNELQRNCSDEGISKFECAELKGHLDCVTGLVIRDGFVFSSSYDKTVKVWSLQNYTCIHSFKGHDHRIMALVLLDGEEPFCISGDYKGFICFWKAEFPFSESPALTLDEKTDWRFSGIHAMAVFGRQYLYTGGGDRLVKAWSLQDHSLSCAMGGHKATVTSLMISHGILYSGSWDGTIRLWSLSDHSPLAVFGGGEGGNASSISSMVVEKSLLVTGHEDGMVKIWRDDVLLEHKQIHKGVVYSLCKNGRFLFSGGSDKTLNVQALSEEADGLELSPLFSITCNSTITVVAYCQGKLFVGQAGRVIKVYH